MFYRVVQYIIYIPLNVLRITISYLHVLDLYIFNVYQFKMYLMD